MFFYVNTSLPVLFMDKVITGLVNIECYLHVINCDIRNIGQQWTIREPLKQRFFCDTAIHPGATDFCGDLKNKK